MGKLTFVVHEPNQTEVRRVRVESGLTLGRNPQCGLVLQDDGVSANQARVVDLAGSLFIEDLGSTNPTRVGGAPMSRGQQLPLSHGTTLVMGQTRIDVVLEGAPSSSDATVVTPPADAAAEGPATRVAPAVDEGPAMVDEGPAMVDEGPATVVDGPAPGPAVVVASAPVPAAEPTPEALAAESMPTIMPGTPGFPGAPGMGGDQTFATLAYGEQTFDPNDPKQMLALQTALRAVRPRLVLANEADRRIVDITEQSVTVGRTRGAAVQISHPGVSSEHARIEFDGTRHRFFIEDLGGRNKTFVNNEMLTAGASRELPPEAHVRFGPIDALFVVDADSEGQRVPAEKYAAAVEVLTRENVVQPSQRSRAQARASAEGRHVGEMLLLDEVITIRQWQRAYQQGEVLLLTGKKVSGEAGGGSGKKGVMIVAVVAVVVTVAVLAFVLDWI